MSVARQILRIDDRGLRTFFTKIMVPLVKTRAFFHEGGGNYFVVSGMSPFLVEKYNDLLRRIFIDRQSIWDFTFPKKLRLLIIVFQINENFVPSPKQKNIPQIVRHFWITNY